MPPAGKRPSVRSPLSGGRSPSLPSSPTRPPRSAAQWARDQSKTLRVDRLLQGRTLPTAAPERLPPPAGHPHSNRTAIPEAEPERLDPHAPAKTVALEGRRDALQLGTPGFWLSR